MVEVVGCAGLASFHPPRVALLYKATFPLPLPGAVWKAPHVLRRYPTPDTRYRDPLFGISRVLVALTHLIDPEEGPHMATATWNGEVIAESDDTVMVEGNHYFPASSVRDGVLQPSPRTSVCPWKGTASYHDVIVDGRVNAGAAWYYPNPSAAASEIKGRIAFWKGIQVSR